MREIDIDQLKERLTAGEPLKVLDVREADEFDAWHIHGSTNLPVYNALRAGDDGPLVRGADTLPKGRPLVAVCRAGVLSRRAAQVLEGLGYECFSLIGGIRGWGAAWTEAVVPAAPGTTIIQVRRNGKGCLSYLVGANGEAAVVDPSVDAEVYVRLAAREGFRITHVLETHVHADHLSRARELALAAGAQLVLPENGRVTYDYTPIRDGGTIEIGEVTIRALATPGHTGESTCYLVGDEVLLTGDTLFVDSVGRPDLEKGDAGAESGARHLHASLHRRLFEGLGNLRYYPCHHGGAIGFDGQPVGSTLAQVREGLDLLDADEASFVERVVGSLTAKPPNHHQITAVNEGKADLGGSDPLDIEAGPNRCAAG